MAAAGRWCKKSGGTLSVAHAVVIRLAGLFRLAVAGGEHAVEVAALYGALHAGIIAGSDVFRLLYGFLTVFLSFGLGFFMSIDTGFLAVSSDFLERVARDFRRGDARRCHSGAYHQRSRESGECCFHMLLEV